MANRTVLYKYNLVCAWNDILLPKRLAVDTKWSEDDEPSYLRFGIVSIADRIPG